jgi:spermidine synthase
VGEDIQTIKEAFPHTYVFRLTGYEGFVVVASTAAKGLSRQELSVAATRMDRDQRFSSLRSQFRKMAGQLVAR